MRAYNMYGFSIIEPVIHAEIFVCDDNESCVICVNSGREVLMSVGRKFVVFPPLTASRYLSHHIIGLRIKLFFLKPKCLFRIFISFTGTLKKEKFTKKNKYSFHFPCK